ncbi:MAG: glutamate racemase [Candidatus Zixiibacteriota bacterium]|nr:MAG: glutamate racemase [candidate division Zixibacteria bacterium]
MSTGNNHPIGIFDSGVGGLSVLKELKRLLPFESFIYFADSAHAPYGEKKPEEIYRFSKKIVDFFLERKVKLIVIACNTATAHAIRKLRRLYVIPFIGMEPAIKPAALHTKTGHIGVLATAGTFRGKHFTETTETFAKGIQVHTQVGEGLVEAVEQGKFNAPETTTILRKYIMPMLEQNIDSLVLGCTHYLFLCEQIKIIVGKKDVAIINSAEPVALQTKNILFSFDLECNCNTPPEYQFFTTGKKEILKSLITQIEIYDHFEISEILPL